MTRHVRLRELLVGIEGLALLRHLYDGADAESEERLAEVRRIIDDEAFAVGETTSEADPKAGYGAWSDSYDEPGNPIIALEEQVIGSIFAALPPGRALDAACGTGRHTRRLVELGHQVFGVDNTPEMLERARANVGQAMFSEGDLRALPASTGNFDLVVCGLALAHLAEVDQAIVELGRVLRPAGRLVVSVLHPFQAYLGWHAPFQDTQGGRGFIREHTHTHTDYLDGFRGARLRVRRTAEPVLTAEELRSKRRAFRHIPKATTAAYVGLPGVLIFDLEKSA